MLTLVEARFNTFAAPESTLTVRPVPQDDEPSWRQPAKDSFARISVRGSSSFCNFSFLSGWEHLAVNHSFQDVGVAGAYP
jgi:hypothetical protein